MEVEVWPCNDVSVGVFQLCDIEGIGTMAGILWTGIGPPQIRAACVLHRAARADWPDVAEDVRYMGDFIASERNRRQKRSQRGR